MQQKTWKYFNKNKDGFCGSVTLIWSLSAVKKKKRQLWSRRDLSVCSLTVRHWQWTNGPCRELLSAPWNVDWMVLTGKKNHTSLSLSRVGATKTIENHLNESRVQGDLTRSNEVKWSQETCFGFRCFHTVLQFLASWNVHQFRLELPMVLWSGGKIARETFKWSSGSWDG